jgi:hypothetical protein
MLWKGFTSARLRRGASATLMLSTRLWEGGDRVTVDRGMDDRGRICDIDLVFGIMCVDPKLGSPIWIGGVGVASAVALWSDGPEWVTTHKASGLIRAIYCRSCGCYCVPAQWWQGRIWVVDL